MKAVKEALKQLLSNCKDNLKNPSFLLKLLSLLLVIGVICLWWVPTRGETGMLGAPQMCLFAYTAPAYLPILLAMVMTYTLGEWPSRWYQRLLLITGTLLFGTTGAVSVINYNGSDTLEVYVLIMGVICLFISLLLMVDTLLNENILCYSLLKESKAK